MRRVKINQRKNGKKGEFLSLKLSKFNYQRYCVVVVLLMISFLTTPSNTVANEQTTANLVDLQKVIQVDLTNRETNFTLDYTGDTTQMVDNLKTVFEQASQTDDYLHTSLTNWEYKVSGTTSKATLDFTVGYLTTKAQEVYIDASVKTLVPTLITSKMSDVAKETAIHDWLIKHVSYDFTLKQRTAYTALTTGKTVCSGYAMLMEKMLSQAGIKSYIIAGHLSQSGSNIPNIEQENHVWNLVQLNNQWYHVDVTNDWNNPDRYMYFNKGSEFMNKMGFSWNKAQLIRPVEPKQLTGPVTPKTPAKSVNAPNVTKPSVANLPLIPSEAFTSSRIIDFLYNILSTFAGWISTIIQQAALIFTTLMKF